MDWDVSYIDSETYYIDSYKVISLESQAIRKIC